MLESVVWYSQHSYLRVSIAFGRHFNTKSLVVFIFFIFLHYIWNLETRIMVTGNFLLALMTTIPKIKELIQLSALNSRILLSLSSNVLWAFLLLASLANGKRTILDSRTTNLDDINKCFKFTQREAFNLFKKDALVITLRLDFH